MELAALILDEAEVAVVPGEAFGTPGYLRLSYALGDEDLAEGVERLQKLLGEAQGLTRGPVRAGAFGYSGKPPFGENGSGRGRRRAGSWNGTRGRYGTRGSRCCPRHICTCTSPGRCGPARCWSWPTCTASTSRRR